LPKYEDEERTRKIERATFLKLISFGCESMREAWSRSIPGRKTTSGIGRKKPTTVNGEKDLECRKDTRGGTASLWEHREMKCNIGVKICDLGGKRVRSRP